jgi:hypothetical protein
MTRFLLLLHIRTKLFAKTTANETVKVLVEDCPKRTLSSAALHFAEYNGRVKLVSDGALPCLLVVLEVRINSGDVVIYFWEC